MSAIPIRANASSGGNAPLDATRNAAAPTPIDKRHPRSAAIPFRKGFGIGLRSDRTTFPLSKFPHDRRASRWLEWGNGASCPRPADQRTAARKTSGHCGVLAPAWSGSVPNTPSKPSREERIPSCPRRSHPTSVGCSHCHGSRLVAELARICSRASAGTSAHRCRECTAAARPSRSAPTGSETRPARNLGLVLVLGEISIADEGIVVVTHQSANLEVVELAFGERSLRLVSDGFAHGARVVFHVPQDVGDAVTFD